MTDAELKDIHEIRLAVVRRSLDEEREANARHNAAREDLIAELLAACNCAMPLLKKSHFQAYLQVLAAVERAEAKL